MAFVRIKKRGNRKYYYLVESYSEGGKIRQRVLRYLGTRPPMGRQKGLKGTPPKVVVPKTETYTVPPELENFFKEGE